MAVTSFLASLQPLEKALPRPKAGEQEQKPAGEKEREAQDRATRLLTEALHVGAQARLEATEMLGDARVQAESLREAAWQEGFHEGREAGQTAAALETQRTQETFWAEGQAQIQMLTDAIGAARQELWNAQEAEMVAFVLQIARQVVKTEVTQNPEVVASILQNALRRVTDKDHVRIRVSLPDAAYVRGMREDLLNLMDGVKNLEIVDDRRIGQGGCVVETNAGTIDAKIETQLDEVERALAHALDN